MIKMMMVMMMMMMKELILCGWQFNIDLCCNSYLLVATTIFLSSCFFFKVNGLHIEINSDFILSSASVISKIGSMAVQSVKAVPKYVNYKAVGSEISASALPSSKYMSLYLPYDFRIPGLESTEIMGIFKI